MSAGAAFARRWLAARGLKAGAAQDLVADADTRAARYPTHIRQVRAIAGWLAEFLLPLLLLGRLCRASRLNDTDFDQLERRAQAARLLWIRALFLLLRIPLWERMFREPDMPQHRHPLERLLQACPAPQADEAFDVIVIGSGAGGAPVAMDLSGRGHSVAVIESGGLVYGETTAHALERYYLQQAFLIGIGRGGSMVALMAGRNIGGTTPINSGTSLLPRKEHLQRWDTLTGLPFSDGLLTQELERVRTAIGIGVPERRLLGPSAEIFERGLLALGRSGAYVLPRNTPDCDGLGRCPFGCPSFHKLSTDVSFLPPAMHSGTRLFSGTTVERVSDTARGVSVECRLPDGRRRRLHARKCVLAGGALGTPRLIRGSRLGTHWRAAGDGLKMHPAAKVLALMPEPVHGDRGIAQGMGYLAPELPQIVFEGIFTPKGTVAPVLACAGRDADRWLDRYDHAASFGMMALDRASGSVRWVGGMPLVRYTLHRDDARDLGRGMKLMGEAFFAAGAERVLLPLVGLRNEYASAAALADFDPATVRPRHILCSGFHPQGTAAMGRVAGMDHRLLGCRNVFVSDASLMPDTPGVNPQVTIMALSLRLGGLLDAELRAA